MEKKERYIIKTDLPDNYIYDNVINEMIFVCYSPNNCKKICDIMNQDDQMALENSRKLVVYIDE